MDIIHRLTQGAPALALAPGAGRGPRIWRGGLTLCAMSLILSACGTAPVDIAQMEQVVDATLTQTTTPEVQAARAAVSLSGGLQDAVLRAVQINESYLAAAARATETLARIDVVASDRSPQVTATTNLGAIAETLDGSTTTTAGATLQLNVAQLVYDGGASTAAVNSATAQALAARAEWDARANEVALAAADAWIDVWQFQGRLGLLRMRTAQMDTLVEQMERMASNGMLDRAALDSARLKIVGIALEDSRLEADLREAEVRFARLFNAEPGNLAEPAELVTLAQARAAAQDWQHAPALQRAATELLMARTAVDGAQAALGPRASLRAGLQSPADPTDSTDATLGVSVEYTLGDGGRRQAQLEAAQARVAAAEAQLTDGQRMLEAELDASLAQLAAMERAMPLIAEQISLSASEAETSRSQIATGQASLSQLVEAEIQNYRGEDKLIAMRAERQYLLLTIGARTGALAQLIGLPAVAQQ